MRVACLTCGSVNYPRAAGAAPFEGVPPNAMGAAHLFLLPSLSSFLSVGAWRNLLDVGCLFAYVHQRRFLGMRVAPPHEGDVRR
jgi:hypothetical protein